MGDLHNGRGPGFHHQEQSIPMDQGDFFGQSELSLASYNNGWDSPACHSHNGLNIGSGPLHDDTFSQRGFYNPAASHLQGLLPGNTQSRPSFSHMSLGYPSVQQPNQPFNLQGSEMSFSFNDQAALSQITGQYGYAATQYQQYPQHQFQEIPLKKQGQDDDNESVGSATTDCDSNCGLADPCTDESCASREDACTDKHCPEKDCPDTNCPEKMPSEVVVAAATLAAFGVGPSHQQSHVLGHQGMDGQPASSSQQHFYGGMPDMTSITPLDVVKHITSAHSNPASSHCMRPCPIDNPQVFEHFHHCPLPDSFDFQMESFSDLYNPFSANNFTNNGASGFAFQNEGAFHGCGAEIPDVDALVEHFNTQHRPLLDNVLAQGSAYSTAGAPQFPSRTLSSSSSNALVPSPSSESHSPQVSFPPTPLSYSQDLSKTHVPSGHHSRSSTVSQGNATNDREQQQCLWCSPETGERCGRVFPSSEELFAHVNTVHIQKLDKGSDGFLCCWENCKRRGDGKEGFPQRSKIERHMHTHIGRKPYKCEQCEQRFSAQQALTQHMLIHSNKKPLRCDWEGCGKTFRQQSALTMHRRIHTGDKPLKCPVCGKAFSESSNLSKHKRIHEVKGRFSCTEPGCDKTFHRLDQLRRHQKSHPGTAAAMMGGEVKSSSQGEIKIEVDDVTQALMVGMETPSAPPEGDGEPVRKKRSR